MSAASEAVGAVSELINFVDEVRDRNVNSLSNYTKKTLISSRVYIEDQISGEPTILNILKLCNQIYAGMVLVALGLNNLVSKGKTVRNMLNAVATESLFQNSLDLINNSFGDKPVTSATEGKHDDDSSPSGSIKEVKIESDPSKLFTGRLMETELGSGNNKAKLYFYVQLLPKIIPSLVLEQFMENNVDPSTSLRWAQWKAGEIKFWRDFVFEADRIAKRKKALKLDKDGILREIEDQRSASVLSKIWNWIKPAALTTTKRNVANTIILISKNKMDHIVRDMGIKLSNYNQRQRLMSDLMSLMLVVYDPNYETIEVYMNGIQNYGQYSAAMVNAAVKKDDGVDLKQLMTLIAASNAPKF